MVAGSSVFLNILEVKSSSGSVSDQALVRAGVRRTEDEHMVELEQTGEHGW